MNDKLTTPVSPEPPKQAPLVINPASKPFTVQNYELPTSAMPQIKIKRTPFILRRWKSFSFFLLCILPSLLGLFYFGFYATNQYVTEIKFAVRSQEAQSGDTLGGLTGLPGAMSSLTSDSYIVVNYIQSREAVDELERTLGIRKQFSDPNIDWIARFNDTRQVEYLVDYWRGQLATNYDILSGVITVKVRSFSPQSSYDLAGSLLLQSEKLINRISQKSRSDVMRNSEDEVKRAEERLTKVRIALKSLRERESTADPLKQAGTKQEMIAKAQADLATLNAELSSARRFMNENAPSIIVLKSRQKSIEDQIRALNIDLIGGTTAGGATVTSMLAAFEALDVERLFAEKAMASALTALEKSRMDADRQQRYLATFIKPTLPEYPLYPRWILMIFITFILSFLIWAIFAFIAQAVKDHIG